MIYSGNKYGNDRLYTGREYDGEINLYYYRARYYSADLGRFISRDPNCATTISVTTTCVGVTGGLTLASGGVGAPSMILCIPSGVTAGASCGVTAGGAAVAGLGNYIMSSSNGGEGVKEFKDTKPGLSGKEGAKDVPSWAKGEKPYVGENGKDFAKRLLEDKYGKGNYDTGPSSEFNKIRKWGDRNFQ